MDDNFGYNTQPGGGTFIMNNDIKSKISSAVKGSTIFKVNNFKAHAKAVVSINICDSKIHEYNSISEAAKELHISRGTLGSTCNKKGKALSLCNKLWFFKDAFDASKISEYIAQYNKRKKEQYSKERNKKISTTKILNGQKNSHKYDYLKHKVLCIETNTIYNSISDAAIATNICAQNISMVCNGNRLSAGKLHWKFI